MIWRLWPTFCSWQAVKPGKLPPQLWRNSIQVQRPENWGACGVNLGLSLKAWEPGAPMSKGWRKWIAWLEQRELLEVVPEKLWPPVDPWARSEQVEIPEPLPILGMCIPPTNSLFRDAALRRCGVGETFWTEYVTEPSEDFAIHFQGSVGWMGRWLILQPPKRNLVCKFPCLLNLPALSLE